MYTYLILYIKELTIINYTLLYINIEVNNIKYVAGTSHKINNN